MKTIKVITTGFFVLMMAFSFPALAQVDVGESAPNFSFTSSDGEEFTLSEHRGKVVFIFLFGNTCPSCLSVGNKTETQINGVFKSNENFVAVGLDMWNSSSSVASVSSFKSQTGITYPLLVKAGNMGSAYGSTYDRLLVIDQNGILKHKGTRGANADISTVVNVIMENLTTSGAGNLSETSKNKIIGVFPNPSFGDIQLRIALSDEGPVKLKVYNSLGQIVLDREELFDPGINDIELSSSFTSPGIHFYKLELQTGELLTGKFIIRR